MKSRLPLVALAVVSLGLPSVASAGDYIVVLKDGVHAGAVTDSGAAAAAGRAVRAAAKRHRAVPSFVYAHAVRSYAATLDEAALARAQADPSVALVVEDREFSLPEPVGNGRGSAASGGALDASAAAAGGDDCFCARFPSLIVDSTLVLN